jgi:hypothetical protein
MQKFKSAIYLLLETEKRVNEQIELLKLKNKEQSIVATEKCHAMINAFLNIILQDELSLKEKFDKLHSNEISLDIGFFSNDFLSNANVIYNIANDKIDTDEIVNEIHSRIMTMRFEYLSFKSSNHNLFS